MSSPEMLRTAAEPIAPLAELIRARLPADQAEQVAEFARQYYGQVAPEDLAERQLADLYGAALTHWHFARVFAGGAPKLRVYNPRLEEHGWQSTHTVIEIVNDDMPFLVDSITMEVNRQGLTLHLIIHPVMKIRRDAEGRIGGLAQQRDEPEGRFESLIHVEVDRRTEARQLQALHDGLLRTLGDVRAAVQDWQPMREQLLDIVADLERKPPPVEADDLAEGRAFLQWIADDNFTLLGYRDYDLVSEGGEDALRAVPGSGLGILRQAGAAGAAPAASASFAALPPEVRARSREPTLLVLTKSNARHRAPAGLPRPPRHQGIGVSNAPPGPTTRPRPTRTGYLRQRDRGSGAHSDRHATPPGAHLALICGLDLRVDPHSVTPRPLGAQRRPAALRRCSPRMWC